jgi:hypothetical protein
VVTLSKLFSIIKSIALFKTNQPIPYEGIRVFKALKILLSA